MEAQERLDGLRVATVVLELEALGGCGCRNTVGRWLEEDEGSSICVENSNAIQ